MKKISLTKKDIICEMIIIKKRIKDKLSILIETDPSNYCYSYSIKINEDNIQNENGESLNIIHYLEINQNKGLIKDINDSEIIVEFEIDKLYKIKDNSDELNNITIETINGKDKDIFILSIKIQRNEYYVFWRDNHFEMPGAFGKTLEDCKSFCYEEANMSFYYERSIENALKFIKTKINDKLILISNIGRDLSGKRFAEIARKIYGFDLIVLFYSSSEYDFIKEFPNCLYTTKKEFYQKYITNFNEEGLKELKNKIESEYPIELNGFPDSLEFYFKETDNSFLLSSSINLGNYIRHVYIKNGNNYLYMAKDKQLKIIDKPNKECEWDVTILDNIDFDNNNLEDNTITFYSNNYYLKDNYGSIEGYEYMEIWHFIKQGNYYYFISDLDKDYILSIIKGKPKLKKNKKIKENQLFQLIDVKDDDYNILNNISSHSISMNIKNDQLNSISIDNSI